MSASKAKGTRWETAIVEYLRANGVPHAERRALNGSQDRGDVAGIPRVVVEAKNRRSMTLAAWVDEAEKERATDGADIGVVWHHRVGKGSPADGYVTMSGATFMRLLVSGGYIARALD
jgi:hypothetical protein